MNNSKPPFIVQIPEDGEKLGAKGILYEQCGTVNKALNVVEFDLNEWEIQDDGTFFPKNGVNHEPTDDNLVEYLEKYQTELNSVLNQGEQA